MEKLKMQSPNFAEENIEKLAELFPECVTETTSKDGTPKTSIDFDLLRQELSTNIVEGPQERYHLNWPGKRDALFTANTPIAKTLRPCREDSVEFDSTENLFIEGDNLDALKLLQETYLGKIKMIYIDPPYNTGRDFIYADNFAESVEEYLLASGQKDKEGNRLIANTDANGRFHSDWLSMMYSRLKLARNLLKNDGVLFISIDDSELKNISSIVCEIFGEHNFIHCLTWQKKVSPSNDSQFFSNDHEYILVVAKEKKPGVINRLERSKQHNKYYKNPDNDPRGDWNSIAATCNKNSEERPNLYYPVQNPNTQEEIWPRKEAVWAFSKDKMNQLFNEGRVYWGGNGLSKSPRIKNFLTDAKKVVPRSVLLYSDVGHTQSATNEFRSLMPSLPFDYPKPSSLITHLAKLCSQGNKKDDFIVLDFFAGSSTTAHAVMQLNANDGGKRKFIMIQLPEACDEKSAAYKEGYTTIAEISKERIRRAGKKIKEENALLSPNLDAGFRVLKVGSSNMEDVYYAPDAVEQNLLTLQTDNIKGNRSSEDLLFQVLLDWGVDLTLPITKETIDDHEVFFVDGNALAACFAKNGQITENFCKELAKRQPLRVVFQDSGFKDDSIKINVEQIFKLMSPHTDVKTI